MHRDEAQQEQLSPFDHIANPIIRKFMEQSHQMAEEAASRREARDAVARSRIAELESELDRARAETAAERKSIRKSIQDRLDQEETKSQVAAGEPSLAHLPRRPKRRWYF